MFSFAVIIGVYSYIIFFLGVAGLLFKNYVFITSLVYIGISFFLLRNKISICFGRVKNFFSVKDKLSLSLTSLIIVQVLVNFIGVLGPEISFDALWYHLTLPKIYILNHGIFHIPGNLLYYSDMPKLTEMLYIPSLMFSNEITAKLIHFSFGILVLVVLYRLSRRYFSKSLSLLVLIIFYSNLVVEWESVTAYVDLARTFFEISALLAFIIWVEEKKTKLLIYSAVILGFAIASKVIALESLLIFLTLFLAQLFIYREPILKQIKNMVIFIFFSILVPLPWFIFSFLNTKNPLYPFFDSRINIGTNFVFPNILNFPKDFLSLLIFSSDPISPLYLIMFPLLIILFTKVKNNIKLVYVYSLLALILWYLTPRIGGGRFVLPYLPAFSLVTVYCINLISSKKLKFFLISIALIISLSSIGYRFIANERYIPVILGRQTKTEYLTKHLNFSFGDFYDTDNYFKSHIKNTDRVLLYGFHNLYYVDFPFTDSSYVKKGETFNYIALQNTSLPGRFNSWNLVYYNPITHVKLYSMGGEKWVY